MEISTEIKSQSKTSRRAMNAPRKLPRISKAALATRRLLKLLTSIRRSEIR